jgi:hypothetical protein
MKLEGIGSFRKFAEEQYNNLANNALDSLVMIMRTVVELADQTIKGLSNYFFFAREQGNTVQREGENGPEMQIISTFEQISDDDFSIHSTLKSQELMEEIKALVKEKNTLCISWDGDDLLLGEEDVLELEMDDIPQDDREATLSISNERLELLKGLNGNDLVSLRVFLEDATKMYPEDKEIAEIYKKVKAMEDRQIESGIEFASK